MKLFKEYLDVIPNKKLIKFFLITVLVISYLTVWFCFGIKYQHLQNHNDNAFIVNNDLVIESQIEAFNNEESLVFYDGIIKSDEIRKLIDNNAYGQYSQEIRTESYYDPYTSKLIEDGYQLFLYPNTIGEYWAEWYQSLLLGTDWCKNEEHEDTLESSGDRIESFDYKLLKKVTPDQYFHPINSMGDNTSLKENIYEIEVDLFGDASKWPATNIMYIKHDTDDTGEYIVYETGSVNKPDKKFTFWIIESGLKNFENLIDNEKSLKNLLKYSLVDLNHDYSKLNCIISEGWNSELIDFLYFSAVTITTTGYGDILPNSREVRIYVMIESLLGVLLPGAFISALFLKTEKYKTKKKINRQRYIRKYQKP